MTLALLNLLLSIVNGYLFFIGTNQKWLKFFNAFASGLCFAAFLFGISS